jgi:hypothetical protein
MQKVWAQLLSFLFTVLISPLPTARAAAEPTKCGTLLSSFQLSLSTQMSRIAQNAEMYLQTSGFQNVTEIEAAAEKATGPDGSIYRQALDILQNEHYRIEIRQPQEVRDGIAKNGFLNLHEVGTSQGTSYDRSHIEATYSMMDLNSYGSLPNKIKPKYGSLSPTRSSNLKPSLSLNYYTGGDHYFFKLDNIRPRLTMTAGDSLNRFVYWHGDITQRVHPVQSWDQIFWPYNLRVLLVPVLAAGLKEARLGLPAIDPHPIKASEYGNQFDVVGSSSMSSFKMAWQPNMDYIEVQIWGDLSLDDVSTFEYEKTPPKGAFLRQLKKRNIQIRKH